jgi:hypothetical protein
MGKPEPNFWWEIVDGATAIIVQSDWPGGQELARFVQDSANCDMQPQIDAAEKLIAEYRSGRKTPEWRK